MKKLSVLLIVFLFIGCYSTQVAPLKQRQRAETIQLSGMSKDKIYKKSLQWFATKFGSANDIIQYKDAKEGKIIGKIITSGQDTMFTFNFYSTITIDAQNNKSDIKFEASSMDVLTGANTQKSGVTKGQVNMLQESYVK
jgi:hypothetical protein